MNRTERLTARADAAGTILTGIGRLIGSIRRKRDTGDDWQAEYIFVANRHALFVDKCRDALGIPPQTTIEAAEDRILDDLSSIAKFGSRR